MGNSLLQSQPHICPLKFSWMSLASQDKPTCIRRSLNIKGCETIFNYPFSVQRLLSLTTDCSFHLSWSQESRVFQGYPSSIAGIDPHIYCFQCLGHDHAESGVQQPPACVECQAFTLVRRQQCWENSCCCDESELECVATPASTTCPNAVTFHHWDEMMASPPEDDISKIYPTLLKKLESDFQLSM